MKHKYLNFTILFAVFVITLIKAQTLTDSIDDDASLFQDELAFNLNGSNLSMPLSYGQSEILNQTHASSFRAWLDLKSDELHELNLNFSGYNLLNETYNVELRQDAQFAYINFTEMIMNISQRIGDVLYNKTLIVKDLSDLVENTYDEFQRNDDEIKESIDHIYLDSKSPKTFCDINDAYAAKKAAKKAAKSGAKPAANDAGPKQKKKKRSVENCLENNIENDIDEFHREISLNFPDREKRDVVPLMAKPPKRKNYGKTTTTTTTTTSTTSTESPSEEDDSDYDYDEEGGDGDDEDKEELTEEDGFEENYWDVDCINRTLDENFKAVQKVNRTQSTIQVPTNVYKQDMEINMTAYWSDTLNYQFIENYDEDNELFWQYFCSSNGMFRRYPAAYWGVPAKEDFFDCRLQSWYIMAAASPKDVLILLDISGSMTGLRLEIGRRLIEFIMDTLTDNDFFNVITFSSNSQFLFNDAGYWNTFVQASKANKQKFKEQLENYKNTSNEANVKGPLIKAFNLFNESESGNKGGCNCNKMIMIITDGQSEDVSDVVKKLNPEKKVRLFTYKIGRDMSDPTILKKLACDNNGEYYHVVTLTDINEHIFQYIPVLSRPMALEGTHETTWSNIFIGYLDKELKIAVARPAFLNNTALLAKLNSAKNFPRLKYSNETFNSTESNYTSSLMNFTQYYEGQENTALDLVDSRFDGRYDPNDLRLKNAYEILKNQQVLLGVVGVDVPVLRLISKVSPKYQMGVGIYIMMIDNNGFIVFHPSIKQEIANSAFDSKGSSQSIDIEKFEIPILNDKEFELLENEMIDEMTNNMTLENWKRDGLRVIRRKTEYVYTSVPNTPFSVAIASPSSFGRYYIDLPHDKDQDYNKKIREINSPQNKKYETTIQLYNCSYNYNRLNERILKIKEQTDYCMRYLMQDLDQVLAIKSDLTLHDIYYNKYNFSIFSSQPNLVKSSFYGTYSGITFYLPVTFYRPKHETTTSTTTTNSNENQSTKTLDTTKLPPTTLETSQPVEMEAYNMSLNLFSTESNKHTYSFEKRYYTRSVEFSDYLRTSYDIKDPVTLYFINETSKESRSETISASLPIWLDKVPTSVAGVVYDAKLFKNLLFATPPDCNNEESCTNICDRRSGLNVTCYLVDEHGIVILSNNNQTVLKEIVGQPLYKINPWLMMQLEFQGLYDLIVSGNKLQDCKQPPIAFSSATRLFSFIGFVVKTVAYLFFQFIYILATSLINTPFSYAADSTPTTYAPINLESTTITPATTTQHASTSTTTPTIVNQVEWRIRNSHCFYFGIYSFNITKWKTMDSSELHVWCNGTVPRRYMAGYVKHSNLLMLVVDDEYEVSKCGSIDTLSKNRPLNWNARLFKATKANNNPSNYSSPPEIINRYRKSPEHCYSHFTDESLIFQCSNSANRNSGFFYFISTKYVIHLVVIYSFVLLLL